MAVAIRQLTALVAVLDEGTFTDAAIALGTSQASVSRAVADLESELGVRLLQRTNRGAAATVAGRRVAVHARRVLAEIAAIERIPSHGVGELRIGFAWAAFGGLTTGVHRRWRRLHPDGSLTYVQSATASAGLIEGEADIAVLRRPLDDDRFVRSLVGTEARVAALAADDPLADRAALSLADLSRRVIAIDRATGTTSTELWPHDPPVETRDVHGIEEWLTLVAAGEAVGITSVATATQLPRADVAFVPLLDAPPIAVWLAWWRDDPSPGAAEFRALVTDLYAGARA